jgi:hypothetical protein
MNFEILLNVALNITKQTNKYRLLGRESLIIDQTMYKNLQYMSTVQVIPSYKQILKANKHNLHTNLYTHWKRFMFSEPHQCRGFHLLNGNVCPCYPAQYIW